MPRKLDVRPCPDPLKGSGCEICGSVYVCSQWWRKEATPKKRLETKREFFQRSTSKIASGRGRAKQD